MSTEINTKLQKTLQLLQKLRKSHTYYSYAYAPFYETFCWNLNPKLSEDQLIMGLSKTGLNCIGLINFVRFIISKKKSPRAWGGGRSGGVALDTLFKERNLNKPIILSQLKIGNLVWESYKEFNDCGHAAIITNLDPLKITDCFDPLIRIHQSAPFEYTKEEYENKYFRNPQSRAIYETDFQESNSLFGISQRRYEYVIPFNDWIDLEE